VNDFLKSQDTRQVPQVECNFRTMTQTKVEVIKSHQTRFLDQAITSESSLSNLIKNLLVRRSLSCYYQMTKIVPSCLGHPVFYFFAVVTSAKNLHMVTKFTNYMR